MQASIAENNLASGPAAARYFPTLATRPLPADANNGMLMATTLTINDEQPDETINPLGIKGLGEIGIVRVAAAVANAVYHATGKRVRDLPITLDKVIQFE